jgi:tRNA A-37 threonylcarbamoyl transferase component Bud32
MKYVTPVIISIIKKKKIVLNDITTYNLVISGNGLIQLFSFHFSGMRPKFEARGVSRVLQKRPNT